MWLRTVLLLAARRALNRHWGSLLDHSSWQEAEERPAAVAAGRRRPLASLHCRRSGRMAAAPPSPPRTAVRELLRALSLRPPEAQARLWPRLAQRRLRHGDTLVWGRRIQFKFGMLDLATLRLD